MRRNQNQIVGVASGTKRGFTLIELLVVIAIIAILAAMLLPALSRARETSYRATCQSNLKQVMTAAMHYADAFEGMIPMRLLGDLGYYWPQLLAKPGEAIAQADFPMAGYKQLFCPKLPRSVTSRQNNILSSYGMVIPHATNGNFFDAWEGGILPTQYGIAKPSEGTVLIATKKMSSFSKWPAFGCSSRAGGTVSSGFGRLAARYLNSWSKGGFIMIHGNRGNMAFYDGHAESLSPLDYGKMLRSCKNISDLSQYQYISQNGNVITGGF